MKKIGKYILLTIYLLFVFSSTFYIFTFNEYGVSKIGNYTLFTSNNLEGFKDGTLVIVNKKDSIKKNDKIIYYDTYTLRTQIKIDKVKKVEKTNETETTYTIDDDRLISTKNLIGNLESAKSVKYLGSILDTITSSIGYLVLVVLPILFYLIYIVYSLRKELKESK